MEITDISQTTVNPTEIRFRLGKVLEDLNRTKAPVLIVSRSKPVAWLLPYSQPKQSAIELFSKWRNEVLIRYKKTSADDLIKIIRQDRDRE